MNQTFYRGAVMTKDAVLKAMDTFNSKMRDSFHNWVTYAVKYEEKLYPPKTLVRLATGLSQVHGGGKSINSKFEDLGFEIVTLDDEDTTANSDEAVDEADNETTFSLEEDLETFLVANLGQLEQGLQLYTENGLTGEQVDAKPAGRIDVLAKDVNGNLVVIELKAADADREVCGQIQAYMGWAQKTLAANKQVRGIIVASDFTPRAVLAAAVVPTLALKKYQVSFKFTDP